VKAKKKKIYKYILRENERREGKWKEKEGNVSYSFNDYRKKNIRRKETKIDLTIYSSQFCMESTR
jgi:hypothetical protein